MTVPSESIVCAPRLNTTMPMRFWSLASTSAAMASLMPSTMACTRLSAWVVTVPRPFSYWPQAMLAEKSSTNTTSTGAVVSEMIWVEVASAE